MLYLKGLYFMLFYVKLQRKEVLEKIMLVREKCLIFSAKILCEPWFTLYYNIYIKFVLVY